MLKKTASSHWQDILHTLTSNLQTGQRITTDHLQRLIDLQNAAAADYVEAHIDRLQAASQVRDRDTLVQFVSAQIRAGNQINNRLLNDTKAVGELTLSYLDSLTRRATSPAEQAGAAATAG